MYESFFQFNDRPFAAVPEANRYFPAAGIEEARQSLARAIERADGPGLVIGPAGTGKSLLCQVLARQFRGRFDIVMLATARLCTRRALLQNILFELNLPYRDREEGELRLSLIDHLQPGPRCREGMLLIVDEAHTLPLRLLEEIRMITNLVRDGKTRVRLVLAGGPRLEERFTHPRLDSFNQRLAARCYLQPLSRQETADYVRFQLKAVGGPAEGIFTPDALDSVYQATDGIPRLVNQVCDHALLLACEGGHRRLDAEMIETAWADLQRLPTPWTAPVEDEGQGDVIEFGELRDEGIEQPAADRAAHGTSNAPTARSAEPETFSADLSADTRGNKLRSAHPAASREDLSDETSRVTLRIADPDDDELRLPVPLEQRPAALYPIRNSNMFQDPTNDADMDIEPPSRQELAAARLEDPFGGVFDEEEIVIDRYAELDATRAATLEFPSSRIEAPSDAESSRKSPPADARDTAPATQRPAGDENVVYHAAGMSDSPLHVVEFAQPVLGEADAMSSPKAPATLSRDAGDAREARDKEHPTIALAQAPTGDDTAPRDGASETVHDDDRDMIVVATQRQDDEHENTAGTRGRVARQDYRKLFAQLRKP